jgi:hypothetical protein
LETGTRVETLGAQVDEGLERTSRTPRSQEQGATPGLSMTTPSGGPPGVNGPGRGVTFAARATTSVDARAGAQRQLAVAGPLHGSLLSGSHARQRFEDAFARRRA